MQRSRGNEFQGRNIGLQGCREESCGGLRMAAIDSDVCILSPYLEIMEPLGGEAGPCKNNYGLGDRLQVLIVYSFTLSVSCL